MVGQRTRRTREFTGPTPSSVAIVSTHLWCIVYLSIHLTYHFPQRSGTLSETMYFRGDIVEWVVLSFSFFNNTNGTIFMRLFYMVGVAETYSYSCNRQSLSESIYQIYKHPVFDKAWYHIADIHTIAKPITLSLEQYTLLINHFTIHVLAYLVVLHLYMKIRTQDLWYIYT